MARILSVSVKQCFKWYCSEQCTGLQYRSVCRLLGTLVGPVVQNFCLTVRDVCLQLGSWATAQTRADSDTTAGSSEAYIPEHRHTLYITVPAGQLEIGQKLLKGVYQTQPTYSDLKPQQLLQLLQLADQYDVPKVFSCAAHRLAVTRAYWPWDVVTAVLGLPESLRQQQRFDPVVNTAASLLVDKLGDLEVVWNSTAPTCSTSLGELPDSRSESLRQHLLGLPFHALLQLLQHRDTRVASEHTIVFTILRWYEQQPVGTVQARQLRDLLQQVRMQHCSLLYINTVMMQNSIISACFSTEEWSKAGICSAMPAALKETDDPVLKKFPAWLAGKRPLSRQPQVVVLRLPVTDLKQDVDKCLLQALNGEEVTVEPHHSSPVMLQGLLFTVAAGLVAKDSSGTKSSDGRHQVDVCIDLCFRSIDMPELAIASMTDLMCIAKTTGDRGQEEPEVRRPTWFMSKGDQWYVPNFIYIGPVDSGSGAELLLNLEYLILDDGCLHFVVKFEDPDFDLYSP